jgi:hypothetical protein
VTLIVIGGDPAYTLTLPATGGNVKYAGGINTVPPASEGSFVMISITAIPFDEDKVYMVTISPEFA